MLPQIYTDALEWPPLPCMPCSVVGDNRVRLSLDTKLRLYQTCVLQILLYGAATWTLLANDICGLQSFHMGCQRQILGVRWQDHVKNVDIADTTGLPNITDRRQETSRTHCLGTYSQTGYQRTCTSSLEASHCNESWPLLRYKIPVLVVLEDMDTADWRRNNNQLETDVAECRGAWTSWRAVATDHSRLCVMMMMMMMMMTIQLLKQIK